MGAGKAEIIAGLDIGTTKIACLIARLDAPWDEYSTPIQVLGFAHQASKGVAKGTIVDVQAAEEAIRLAVDAAERVAGVVVQKVWVNLTGSSLFSQHVDAQIRLDGQEIGVSHLRRIAAQARTNARLEDRVLVHAVPMAYQVDGSPDINDPTGMVGERLEAVTHMVSADQSPVRNLMRCIKRCHLEVAGLAASPYASALACLVPDEMELGVTVIEMGGGTTSIAVFYEGRLIYTESLTIGGRHVTSDVARGLSTSVECAERIKTLHGSALPSPSDDQDVIDVPAMGEDGLGMGQSIPRSLLTRIIQPRIEETIELVRDRIVASGLEDFAGSRIVLTGGACQLTGLREITSRILDKPVRIGRPIGVVGFPEAIGGPSFATCAGLVSYRVRAPQEAPKASASSGRSTPMGGHFGRIRGWLTSGL